MPQDVTALANAEAMSPAEAAEYNKVLQNDADALGRAIAGAGDSPPGTENLNENAPPTTGNPSGDPAERKGVGEPDPNQTGADQPPEGKADPDEEEFSKALGWDEDPQTKMQRVERDYAASSREATKLNDRHKSKDALLADQELEWVTDEDGNVTGIAANAKAQRKLQKAAVSYESLSDEVKLLFDTDPQAAVNAIVENAHGSYSSRPAPTAERQAQKPSKERLDSIVSELGSRSDEVDRKHHPNLEKNLSRIQKMLGEGGTSKALKRFFNADPELAMQLLDHRVDAIRSRLTTQAEAHTETENKKVASARSQPSLGPAGGGTPGRTGGTESDADAIGKAIAGATAGY
jgi:hypothetical protein